MRRVLSLAAKDLRLLVRDRAGLFWVIGFPMVMALFFGFVMGGARGGRSVMPIAVVDLDRTDASAALLARLEASPALEPTPMTRAEAREAVRVGKRIAFVVIREGYGAAESRFGPGGPALEIGIDPARQAEAGYLEGIVSQAHFEEQQRSFTSPARLRAWVRGTLAGLDSTDAVPGRRGSALRRFLAELDAYAGTMDSAVVAEGGPLAAAPVEVTPVVRETVGRPRSTFEITFPSAVMWALVACASAFAVSLVLERTEGTLLRLRASPLTPAEVLAGKGLACFVAGLTVTVVLLAIGRLFFGVRLGDPLHLALAVLASAACFVGIMMFLTTLGKTPRAVGGAGWAVLLIMMMLGGGMIPLIAMPGWMQTASSVSPVKWGVLALEGAVWRGFTLPEMLLPCGILIAVGALGFVLGVRVFTWTGD